MKPKAPTKEELLEGKLASLIKFCAADIVDYCERRNDDAPQNVARFILAELPEKIWPYEIKIIKKKIKK